MIVSVHSPTPYVEVPPVVAELQEQFLTSPSDLRRRQILLKLGRVGSAEIDEAFPYREPVARTLVELYNLSVWWPEKRAIIHAMGECRASEVIFRYLLRTLDTFDLEAGRVEAELCTAIIDAFGRIGLPAAGPLLLRRYVGPEVPEMVRLQAFEVLGHLGFREVEPYLLTALDHEHNTAPIVALYALTELVSSDGLDKVHAILEAAWESGELEQDDDRELARAALTYLCTLGDAGATRWLSRLRYTHGPDLRSLALWGRRINRQNNSSDLLDLVSAALEEHDDYARTFWGRNLRRYDPHDVLETGEAFCENEESGVRLVQTLGEVGGDVVKRWLWERFIQPPAPPLAKAYAIRALRTVTLEEGRALLAMAPGSPPAVIVAAIRTASNFGPLELYRPLVELLSDDDALVRQEAVRAIQHLLLAHRPAHVSLRDDKGDVIRHGPDDLPLDDEAIEEIDAGFRRILRRDDDGMTQGLVAYAAANLRRTTLWPRVLKLAEKSDDTFARMAAYHALLDMPDPEQLERLMKAFDAEKDRVARSACIRTLAPLLASLDTPDSGIERRLLETIERAVPGASEHELVIYAHALGIVRTVDPLPVLDKIRERGGHRSSLEVISALGKITHVPRHAILDRFAEIEKDSSIDQRLRIVDALAVRRDEGCNDHLIDFLVDVEADVRKSAVRALAARGRERHGLVFPKQRLDEALERVTSLMREEEEPSGPLNARTYQEDLLDLKLALWQYASGNNVDDERVDRVIASQLREALPTLQRYGDQAEEVLRALRSAEFFHLQSREMPASADLSPAILSYTKAIELWLHIRLTELLGHLRDVAKDNYPTIMDTWEACEHTLRSRVTLPVEDASRAVDWSKVPRVAKAMKEKKFTADWRTLSISNSGAIVIFFGVDLPEYGCQNALGLRGKPMDIVTVAVNALSLAALRNAMAHEQSASRSDLEACRTLAYEVMRGIGAWG